MTETQWTSICHRDDLVPDSGIAALVNGEQVAIFLLSGPEGGIFALDHHDPIGGANVLARGILGDVDGEPVVSSPLYKQHFSLRTGRCLEQQDVAVRVWPVRLADDTVEVAAPSFAVDSAA